MNTRLKESIKVSKNYSKKDLLPFKVELTKSEKDMFGSIAKEVSSKLMVIFKDIKSVAKNNVVDRKPKRTNFVLSMKTEKELINNGTLSQVICSKLGAPPKYIQREQDDRTYLVRYSIRMEETYESPIRRNLNVQEFELEQKIKMKYGRHTRFPIPNEYIGDK